MARYIFSDGKIRRKVDGKTKKEGLGKAVKEYLPKIRKRAVYLISWKISKVEFLIKYGGGYGGDATMTCRKLNDNY